MALQFSLNGTTPFLGMGDAENPVNIWQWRAGWEAAIASGRPDMHDQYASMHVDTYFAGNAITASDAGNPLALRPPSSVEDANARGFGTLTTQSTAHQNVQGKGVWHDGFWNVLFVRKLKSRSGEDVQLPRGKTVPVAFAVWDGAQRDRNGRKVISNWYQLALEK